MVSTPCVIDQVLNGVRLGFIRVHGQTLALLQKGEQLLLYLAQHDTFFYWRASSLERVFLAYQP